MSSVYFEYLPPQTVSRTKSILLLCALLLAACASVLALVLFATAIFPLNLLFAFLCVVLFATLYWMLFPYTSVEVEYCVAGNELRIDRIYANRFRKAYLTVETSCVSRIVPKESAKAGTLDVTDCTGGNSQDVFAVFYREKDATEERVLLLHLPKEIENQLYLACHRASRR